MSGLAPQSPTHARPQMGHQPPLTARARLPARALQAKRLKQRGQLQVTGSLMTKPTLARRARKSKTRPNLRVVVDTKAVIMQILRTIEQEMQHTYGSHERITERFAKIRALLRKWRVK
jgi:hypothetical protein